MTIEFYQKFLYFKLLKQIASDNPAAGPEQIIEITVQNLYQELISEQNKILLQLAFKPAVTQADLDSFLAHWDIEAAGSERAAVLAYMMKMHPELKFDAYTGPRLKGLLDYLRFQNLELVGHFSKIVKRLNGLGIEPMIIKGGAMRYLRPDLPRVMGDIDILLPAQSPWDKIHQLVREMGYIFSGYMHSIDVHPADNPKKGIIDIHQYFSFMPKADEKFITEMFQRATRQKIFLASAYLPAVEDMFFICLSNLANNLRATTSVQGIPIALFDLTYLVGLKKDFNWDIVIQDIIQTHSEAYGYMAIRFINQVLPDIFPKSLLNHKVLRRRSIDQINRDKFYILWVHEVKHACKRLKFTKCLQNWSDLKHYLKMEGQHFLTKRIVKHPSLIRLFFRVFS